MQPAAEVAQRGHERRTAHVRPLSCTIFCCSHSLHRLMPSISLQQQLCSDTPWSHRCRHLRVGCTQVDRCAHCAAGGHSRPGCLRCTQSHGSRARLPQRGCQPHVPRLGRRPRLPAVVPVAAPAQLALGCCVQHGDGALRGLTADALPPMSHKPGARLPCTMHTCAGTLHVGLLSEFLGCQQPG